MTEDDHALVGFDAAADGDDLVVVVLRRDPGGPWQLDQIEWPAPADESWVAEQVAAAADAAGPRWRPPAQTAPTMAELVEQWLAEAHVPDFRLTDEQRAVLSEAYTEAVTTGRLSWPRQHPMRMR